MLFSPLPQTYPCAGCQEAIIVNKVRDKEANMVNNAFSICLLQMRRHVDGDELLTVVCRSPAAYNNYW